MKLPSPLALEAAAVLEVLAAPPFPTYHNIIWYIIIYTIQ